jgi:hypothetical protein
MAQVTTLMSLVIHLGTHHGSWMLVKGVTILKLGKLIYSPIKSYRVISILKYLVKVTERFITKMLSIYGEAEGRGLYNGQ